MSAPSLGRLLISHITLRGPEVRQLYMLIQLRPGIGYGDLVVELLPPGTMRSAFSLEEAPLREALNFLLAAGLVAQDGPSRRKANFRATPLLPSVPFSLLLLRHIASHEDERQRAIALVYRQLVQEDVLDITPGAIRERVERGPFRDLFAWTGEKVMFWTHLTSSLGLVRRLERRVEVLIIPQPELLLAALRWAEQQVPGPSLDACLRLIDETFFSCYTARGRVHRGVVQALTALHRLGQAHLAHTADAAHSVLLGERRVSEIYLLPV